MIHLTIISDEMVQAQQRQRQQIQIEPIRIGLQTVECCFLHSVPYKLELEGAIVMDGLRVWHFGSFSLIWDPGSGIHLLALKIAGGILIKDFDVLTAR